MDSQVQTDGQQTSNSNAPLAGAENEVERVRLLHQIRFFRQADDMDTALHSIVEHMLRNTFTEDNNILSTTDVEEMMEILPDVDRILVTGLFNRVPFPVRMLRNAIAIYNADNVPSDFMKQFRITDEERSDRRLEVRGTSEGRSDKYTGAEKRSEEKN